ncbi:MAG: MgtC/SapB family protein [Candidatus Limivicinus sp.]|jgi:putative Mg2+ transporter-C (MgtC) family protein
MFDKLTFFRELNIYSMMIRIVLAMLIGGMIGFEREKKRRPAGFRTYMLVAMGAALTVILSQYLDFMLSDFWVLPENLGDVQTDSSRFAAKVVNGIGFLGAGTIIVTGRQEVKGLTTAAGLFASACMGIAIGAGFYECMVIGALLILLSLKLLPLIENDIVANARNLSIYIEMDNFENIGEIVNRIKLEGVKVYDIEIEKKKHEHMSNFSVLVSVRLPKRGSHAELLAMLSTMDGIIAIDEV